MYVSPLGVGVGVSPRMPPSSGNAEECASLLRVNVKVGTRARARVRARVRVRVGVRGRVKVSSPGGKA